MFGVNYSIEFTWWVLMEVTICLFIEQINFTFLLYKIINLVAILVLGDSHLKVPINTCVGSVSFWWPILVL